jgi:hypothetical protein
MMWCSGLFAGSFIENTPSGPEVVAMLFLIVVFAGSGIAAARSKGKTEDVMDTFEQEVEAEMIRRDTPPFTKWSEVAKLVNYHFKIAKTFKTQAVFNHVGAEAMHQVIEDMGKTLDKAVDKAWAEAPAAELIARARNLEARPVADKELP